MAQTNEERFLDFLKGAESTETNEDTSVGEKSSPEVYEDPEDALPELTDAVNFSDKAQEVSKDVREGVADRLLSYKSQSDVAERALVGAVLNTKDLETSSIQLKPVEKISHPQTLIEQVQRKLGRL